MDFSDKVKEAKAEAKRFLKRVAEWEAKQGKTYSAGGHTYTIGTPRENGAVRRASMDLTNALANLRRYS